MEQNEAAIRIVRLLRDHIPAGGTPIVGYHEAARLIGWNEDASRPMGQACSRVDYASFVLGLPMLAYQWVRDCKGNLNQNAWYASFEKYRDEIDRVSAAHQWTDEEFSQIIQCLHEIPDRSAALLWSDVESREARQKGFINYNLHRRLR